MNTYYTKESTARIHNNGMYVRCFECGKESKTRYSLDLSNQPLFSCKHCDALYALDSMETKKC